MTDHLVKKLKKLLKNREIIDLVLFGSFVKGRTNSKDIDIMVISNNINKKEIKKEIENIISKKIDIQILKLEDYDKFVWLTMIKEGFSVKHERYLFELYKINPYVLYKYSLKSLTQSKKVMFERAIKNFNNIQKLSNRVVLVPIEISSDFADFLKNWDIDLDSEEYHLLPLVRKEEV